MQQNMQLQMVVPIPHRLHQVDLSAIEDIGHDNRKSGPVKDSFKTNTEGQINAIWAPLVRLHILLQIHGYGLPTASGDGEGHHESLWWILRYVLSSCLVAEANFFNLFNVCNNNNIRFC